MSNETTLLPCPFCGSDKAYPNIELGKHWVECRECTAESGCYRTEAEAIAAWNTRAAKPCYATDHTHDGCKYSVNRGWVENVAHGTLTAEQVSQAVKGHGNIMDNRLYEDWQAVADELNAKLGSGTCENVSDPPEGFLCSECGWGDFAEPSHLLTTAKFTDNDRGPNHCPNCGRRVER